MLPIIVACLLAVSEASAPNICQRNIQQDGLLDFTQLVEKYGQKCEEFDVETEDGYILKLFHITGNEYKKPVLLMHGILDSSDAYVIRGRNSTAINLAESGYDVWVGNVRGNKYSRRHTKLSPEKDKKKFWNFSFHEMGKYDLSAIIGFILERTGKSKISAVGHSQGTTMFYALASVRPEYNQKLSLFISLAPIARMNDVGTAVSVLIKLWPAINIFFEGLGYEGVLQDNSKLNELIKFICSQGDLTYDLCEKGVVGTIAGHDSEELSKEFFNIVLGHYPTGTSRKSFDHYVQIANSGRFAQYDNGLLNNIQLHKSASAPLYNLANVRMPVVLIAAKNDGLSGIKDVEWLKNKLPNVVDYHVMERKQFNHVDYVWGEHINVYLNPLLKKYLSTYA